MNRHCCCLGLSRAVVVRLTFLTMTAAIVVVFVDVVRQSGGVAQSAKEVVAVATSVLFQR